MMLHGSDLVRMQKCPRLAWLEYHHRQESSLPFYNMEDSFSSLWTRAYGLQDTPRGQRGDSMEDSFRILDSLAPGESARFIRIVYRDLRITIPWIRKLEDGWEAIWPMFTARESEAWVMKLARLAAAANGIDIRRQEAVFLNRSYIRQGSLDTGKLFLKSDCLENRKHHLTSSIEDLQADLDVDPDRLIDEACSLFSGPCPKLSTAGTVPWANAAGTMNPASAPICVPEMIRFFCGHCPDASACPRVPWPTWILPDWRTIPLRLDSIRQPDTIPGSTGKDCGSGCRMPCIPIPIWILNGIPSLSLPTGE